MRRLIGVLVVTALMTGLTAVGSAQPAASASAGQMTWAVHFTLAPRWLDPAESEGSITPFLTLYAVHDPMLKPMPSGPSANSLAESWTVSPTGLVYDFTLRANARFHNGERVTAEDVKFSFERYRGANAATFKERVQEVRVLDARRVQFHLKEPWADFITFYGTTASTAGWVVPKKYVEQVGDEGFKKAPIGAGRYKVISFTPGVELQLEAFDGYWRKAPAVKKLIFRSLPDETTRAAALKRGDVDVAYFLNGPIAEEVRRTPGLRLMAVRSNTVFFLDFRGQWEAGSPWQDPRVRTAASLAIDRRTMNDAEQLGFGGLTGNVVPRTLDFALAIDADPYDPARAKRLLAEAGFPNGFPATISYATYGSTIVMDQLQLILKYLKDVGIDAKPIQQEYGAYISTTFYGKYESMAFGPQTPFLDPDNFVYGPHVANELKNQSHVEDPIATDLLVRQRRTMDPGKRREVLFDIQRHLAKQQWYVYLPSGVYIGVWDGALKNYGPNLGYDWGGRVTVAWLDR